MTRWNMDKDNGFNEWSVEPDVPNLEIKSTQISYTIAMTRCTTLTWTHQSGKSI